MASIEKRNGMWVAGVARKKIRLSRSFDTKAKAQAWAGETEAAILNGTYRAPDAAPTAADMTVADLFRRFATKVSPTRNKPKWEYNRIEHFIRENPALANTPLEKCTTEQFADWRDARLKEVAGSTIARDMGLYSTIFQVARKEWKLVTASPLSEVRRPKQPQGRDRLVDADDETESERLLLALGYNPGETPETLSARVGAVWLFAIETGARAGEIVGLTWDRVSLPKKSMHLDKTKMGFARDVALSPRAMELIQQVAPLRDKANKQDSVFKMSSTQLDSLYRKARDRCKLVNLHFHDTRHVACTRLAKKLPLLDLARMLGIRDLDILMVYYNETATSIAEKLAA